MEDGRIEQVNKIILGLLFDLMYAVYRMNSKETYVQFVVDGMGAANDLKNVNVKNAFNIKEVVGKIEDIKGRIKEITIQREKIAEKGTTMDALNEGKFKSQDRPGTYNILVICFLNVTNMVSSLYLFAKRIHGKVKREKKKRPCIKR